MTLGGASGHAYGEASYWDNRYRQDPGPFDWYQKYVALAPLFDLYLQRHNRVLLVGCGNSGKPSASAIFPPPGALLPGPGACSSRWTTFSTQEFLFQKPIIPSPSTSKHLQICFWLYSFYGGQWD